MVGQRLPDESKNRLRGILFRMRDNALELQDASSEMEGLLGVFFEGVSSRIINTIDIALNNLG